MTIADLSKLSDEELRVTLAKLLGWTDCNFYEDNAGPGYWNGYPPPTIGVDANGEWEVKKAKHHEPLPHYTTDLNAVAAVEAGLTVEQRVSYVNKLLAVTEDADLSRITFATARQRAEALYATLTP